MNKPYKKTIFVFIILALIIGVSFLASQKITSKKTSPQVTRNENAIVATTTTTINDYTILFVHSASPVEPDMTDWSKILIQKDNKTVFETDATQDFSGFYVNEIGDWIKSADEIKTKAMKDVTGDGVSELVLSAYSGGSHCCSQNYIIGLTTPLHFYLNLDTGDYGIEFKDINKDGKMEIETSEDVFSYWHTSFGGSPMPRVVLSLYGDTYKADATLMRHPAPTDIELQKKADAVKSWSSTNSPEVPWNYAIDLIYSGNIGSARKYVDLAWHDGGEFKSKQEFWNELAKQIHTSPYYADLASYFGI